MAETEGLFHFYIQTDFGRYTNARFCRAYQLDDEGVAIVQEGGIPLFHAVQPGPWANTPEEAIIGLLWMQLEAADG